MSSSITAKGVLSAVAGMFAFAALSLPVTAIAGTLNNQSVQEYASNLNTHHFAYGSDAPVAPPAQSASIEARAQRLLKGEDGPLMYCDKDGYRCDPRSCLLRRLGISISAVPLLLLCGRFHELLIPERSPDGRILQAWNNSLGEFGHTSSTCARSRAGAEISDPGGEVGLTTACAELSRNRLRRVRVASGTTDTARICTRPAGSLSRRPGQRVRLDTRYHRHYHLEHRTYKKVRRFRAVPFDHCSDQ